MKQVQEALRLIGVPVMAGVWRTTTFSQNPPEQYVVSSTVTAEAAYQDDCVCATRTFVYMTLWSDCDPTETAGAIREAMYNYGFAMTEESDRSYSKTAYDPATRQYTIQWTWCWHEEVHYGAARDGRI